jgi:hypothetical protein
MALKLGSQTGSLMNHLYSRQTIGQPDPVVGMGATILSWTDRHPATIIAVEKTKTDRWLIVVQEDNYERTDNNGPYTENQDYTYTPNPKAAKQMYRYDEGRGWRTVTRNEKGRLILTGGSGLRIGEREKYRDPSF